ncbi:MAG: MBL fold metallo-hydrolase [Anaerolineales bacterium]|jgi:glyoxylase-like metal-dependent hydrolase (beta-lactamase superfamily II)
MHRIGDLEFAIVSDGRVWVDAGGPFGLVPRALYESILTPTADNTIPMDLNCLLLRSEGKVILIDTGLGNKLTPEAEARWGLERPQGGLIDQLALEGVEPEAVDLVLNTHLHTDHCGGNTVVGESGPIATFPNAEYWVQRLEWSEASHPDARTRGTYFSANFEPLLKNGQLRLLHGNMQVTKHIRCVVTPGHTRAHQSILLEMGAWKGLYVADMASYVVNMEKTAWLTAYDVLPLENIATKERWQRWALENEAWLFFEHDPQIKIAQLHTEDGRLKAEPIDVETLATG